MHRWAGFAFALGATIIWSGNFIVARELNESVSPAVLAFLRWLTACLALTPLAGLQAWKARHIIRGHLGYLLPTALLGVTVFNTLIYTAARTSTALNLSLIATSTPIFIILMSRIFLKEPVTRARAAGLLTALGGVLVLITRGDFSLLTELSFAPGDIWMLTAAMVFGGYTIMVRRKPLDISQGVFLMSTFGLGLLMLFPWALMEALFLGLPPFSAQIAGSVLYVGLGASLASFFLWTRAIGLIGPARAALIYYTLPLFSGLGAYVLLGEPVGWIHGLSAVMILGGIIIATRN